MYYFVDLGTEYSYYFYHSKYFSPRVHRPFIREGWLLVGSRASCPCSPETPALIVGWDEGTRNGKKGGVA